MSCEKISCDSQIRLRSHWLRCGVDVAVQDLVRDDNRPNVHYALKRILCQTSDQLKAAQSEIKLHQAISHPFVLSLIASDIQLSKSAEIQSKEALLLFPLYPRGSIVDVIARHVNEHSESSPWPFPEHEALRIFYAIGQGVQAIHGTGLAHRDIKPHNVLLAWPYRDGEKNSVEDSSSSSSSPSDLASEPIPILIDLGSADSLVQTPADRKGAFAIEERAAEHSTASYRAPELFDVRVGQVIDEKADLFSMALTLYYMAFGCSAFENENDGVMTLAIKSGNLTIPEEFIQQSHPSKHSSSSIHPSRLFSDEFCTFLREMVVADPTHRLTVKDAMKKSVILMMAALEKHQTQQAKQTSMPPDNDDDEFGSFTSASGSSSIPPALTPATLDVLITDMQIGSSSASIGSSTSQSYHGGFLKFGRKGSPHSTRLQLTSDKSCITYTSKGGAINSIPIRRIFGIVTGQVTTKFTRFKAMPEYAQKSHLCFSILLKPDGPESGSGEEVDPNSGESTLDLLADSHQLYRTWTMGLQALLDNPAAATQPTVGI